MRKTILLIALILTIGSLQAQNFQGQAIYQTKVSFTVDIDNSESKTKENKEIQEAIRKGLEKKYILNFNRFESTYTEEEKLDQPGSSAVIIFSRNRDIYYKNLKENRYVRETESFSKGFLIKDSIKSIDWQLTKESKTIGNYMCFKAVHVKQVRDYQRERKEKISNEALSDTVKYYKDIEIVAWYTPEVPVNNGPAEFGGLPGLILELHKDKTIYLCEKIVINPKDAKPIVEPDKGKVVSQQEYDAIIEKKSKEFMEMHSQKKGKRKKGRGMTITIGG